MAERQSLFNVVSVLVKRVSGDRTVSDVFEKSKGKRKGVHDNSVR